jgi:cytochrome c-type biogenesis protein CcmH/NrfG
MLIFVSCTSSSSKQIPSDDIANGTLLAKGDKNFDTSQNALVKGAGGYFYFSNNEILKNAMKGTPESLRKAVSLLYKSNQSYSDAEKTLIVICTDIMKKVWIDSNVSWDVPDVLPENIYLSTLRSSLSGVYEPVQSSDDFFSLILPSLTMFTSTPIQQFSANAEIALKKSLELQPDSIISNYMLGLLYLKTNQNSKAIPLLKKAVIAVPSENALQIAFIEALENNGDIDGAYQSAQKLLLEYPEKINFLVITAKTAYAAKDYKNADIYISKVLQQEPGNSEYLILRAKILFEEQNYLKVSTMLDVYSRNNPITREYLLLRAQLQITWNKNTAAAKATLEDAINRYPSDIEVILLAAELASSSSQNISGKTALELSEFVLKTDPENVRALLVLVTESMKDKKWNEAYISSKKLLEMKPNQISAYLLHIEICLELNQITEASQTIETVKKSFFTDGVADADRDDYENFQKWNLRVLCAEFKKTEAAALISSLMTTATPNLKSILFYEQSCIEITDAAKLTDLRSSLTFNPRNSDSLYALYRYYYDKADYRKARYYLRQVIALNSSDPDLLTKNNELDALLSE